MATLWRIYNENQGTRKNVVPGTSRAVAWAQAPSLLKLASPSYFVATTGSDANPGTLASPFLTLSKGVSVLNPGDTLYIRGGTYLLSSQLNISRSGTAAQRITIDAYPGESVVISGDVNGRQENGRCS